MKLRIISFNIHKGYNLFNRRYSLSIVRELLETHNPDLVLLQELHGMHPEQHSGEKPPLEELADKHWPFYSHGVNSVYKSGYHGNAILSRYPIKRWNNTDISTNPLERRGLLHAQIDLPQGPVLNVFCTHLNLSPPGQTRQAQRVLQQVQPFLGNSHVILAGDFNDWTGAVRRQFTRDSHLTSLKKIKTFPSTFPVLGLDGFFYRDLTVNEHRPIKDFRHCSDHLPILVDCEIPS